MVDEWMKPKEHLMDVGKWMAELEERLEAIRTQVTDNGMLARAQSKRYFDAKARTREFPQGSMVLLRMPGLTGKMKESWTGLFEVLRRVMAVNVELGSLGRSKKKCSGSRKYYQTLLPTRLQGPSRHGGGRRPG